MTKQGLEKGEIKKFLKEAHQHYLIHSSLMLRQYSFMFS